MVVATNAVIAIDNAFEYFWLHVMIRDGGGFFSLLWIAW